jgi:tetratricopeptide (TPR) repeat protein
MLINFQLLSSTGESCMANHDKFRWNAASAVFMLGVKTSNSGIHRTLNKAPKGKGWIPAKMLPEGLMYKPDKVIESIEYFKISHEIFPDIVALNQIAIGYELLGEHDKAIDYFNQLLAQAIIEKNAAYQSAAELGIERNSSV